MSAEAWKAVVGWEGIYEVSDLGRIRRIAAYSRYKNKEVPHFIKPASSPLGYLYVSFNHVESRRRGIRYMVHALVAQAFIGPRPKGMWVNHINKDRGDPRASNLEYVTPKQNARHSIAEMRAAHPRGSNHHASKLKEDQVREIKKMLSCGHTQKTIASVFGVSRGAIKHIKLGNCWSHI